MPELPEVALGRDLERLAQLRERRKSLKGQLKELEGEMKATVAEAMRHGGKGRRVCQVAGISSRTLYILWREPEESPEQGG